MSDFTLLEPVFSALNLDSAPAVVLVEARVLGATHVPSFPSDLPAVITQISSIALIAEVKSSLEAVYPVNHLVRFVHARGSEGYIVEDLPLDEIDRGSHVDSMIALYIPPLEKGTSFESFQEIIAHLRAPDGCPWDREQTHLTLRDNLLEETYEVLAALDAQDPTKMREEFGDLLLQIVLNAQIASEVGEFTMTEVLKGIYGKIIYRHPHVFGNLRVEGVKDVLQNWEKLKAAERKAGGEEEKSLLDGVPLALPGLIQAQEYQDRAARVGFDWPEIGGVLDKIKEEIGEVRGADNPTELTAELGDLFFALVNLARWKKVDAESALREANLRFKRRFKYVEKGARKTGRPLQELSLEEMDVLWNEAKRESR
jgi:tetrapyrrole methylase family protein/MazG family protein